MKPLYDELLDEDPESQAFDADTDPVDYLEELEEDSNLAIEEPKIINIGRKNRKDEVHKMRGQRGNS